ncbi:MAG: aminotransferase class I/II-fold pyridoxal phosphate-dependent enzyme, partial [Bacillus sp. (in: firmicutes)]
IANDFLESENFHSHIEKLVKELEKRRDQIAASLSFHLKDQVDFSIPQGGIHLWCRIKKDINEMQLLEESIKRGVIYVPGSTMGSKKGYVRFTYAREDQESINEGIKRFAEALYSL